MQEGHLNPSNHTPSSQWNAEVAYKTDVTWKASEYCLPVSIHLYPRIECNSLLTLLKSQTIVPIEQVCPTGPPFL